MTDEARTLSIPLDFLGSGSFEGTRYADVRESETTATRVGIEKLELRAGHEPLTLTLVRGGGAAIQLRPTPP